VVAMFVERMLPAALADDAQQHLLAWMHVRIAVVRLVGVLWGIIRVHVVGHRASVDHKIRRNGKARSRLLRAHVEL